MAMASICAAAAAAFLPPAPLTELPPTPATPSSPSPRLCPRCRIRPSPSKRARRPGPTFSRRAFLVAAAAAALSAASNPPPATAHRTPLIDSELHPRPLQSDEEGVLDWMRTPEERFGFEEHDEPHPHSHSIDAMEAESTRFTTATADDYARVTHVGAPNDVSRMAKVYTARAAVTGFVAAYCAVGMAISERESLRTKLPVVYDPTVLNLYFRIRPDKVLRRMILFSREIAALAFERARNRILLVADHAAIRSGTLSEPHLQQREKQRQIKWAQHLREAMTRLGPAVIKFGQAAATRQDLFDASVVKELQKLQDDVLPFFPTSRAFDLIRQELGSPPDSIFEYISPDPVAGASLGMVFKGRVEGVPVAVKVQRPEVAEQIAMDCYIVRYLATITNFLLRSRTDFALAVDEYASRLFEELDYTTELKNMAKFRALYGHMNGIYLPKVFEQYSSQRVLVTEWVDGVKLIDEEAKVKAEDIGLVETGIRFALMQLLDKGYLHAVLKTKSGYLAYIDFGLVSEVPLSVRESLVCALMHLIHGEYEYLAETFVGLAVMRSDDVEIELPLLSEALRDALEPENIDFSNDEDGEMERLRRFTLVGIVGKLLTLGNRFPFVFNDYFLNNLRCLGMLEGLALNADPNFSILGVVYPYVVRRILSDPSPRFRRALGSLVIDSYGRMRWSRMGQLLQDVQATAATTTFDYKKAWSKGFASPVRQKVSEPFHTDTQHGRRITRIEKDDGGTSVESKISKPAATSPDLILQFVTSKSGGFLREYIIKKFTSNLERDWTTRIDKLLGTTNLPSTQGAGDAGFRYDDGALSRRALQTTERELSDEETRKRTRVFFRRSPFWKRCRVLLRLAPGFLFPLLKTLMHISLHFISRSLLVLRGNQQRKFATDSVAASLAGEQSIRQTVDDRERTRLSATQDPGPQQKWRPFNSRFLRRTQTSSFPSSVGTAEYSRTKAS